MKSSTLVLTQEQSQSQETGTSIPWVLILEMFLGLFCFIAIMIPFGYLVMYCWAKYQRGTDYNYNIFDDPELNSKSKAKLKKMKFKIPAEYEDRVKYVKSSDQFKGKEIQFNQQNGEFIGKCILFMPIQLFN
jgi:hypothetical protein